MEDKESINVCWREKNCTNWDSALYDSNLFLIIGVSFLSLFDVLLF